ncbi:hypothetical protein ELQ90_02530 [Labedella phragmitis]|uniref:RHS repeat protein n=1 Tax=Labedella phragmitis TaxID=2498849 RepID=A0A444PY72_9MICO|nr:hypothetical protein [Labedella phragmitis]RWZ52838.1 hypothetical protein ELQ90_02530 [Labedella phragmitis]
MANSYIATTTDASASGPTPGNSTTYSYDAIGTVTSVSLPTGAVASATYATGTSRAGTGGTKFQPNSSIDAAGNGKKFDYDGNNNVIPEPSALPRLVSALPPTRS